MLDIPNWPIVNDEDSNSNYENAYQEDETEGDCAHIRYDNSVLVNLLHRIDEEALQVDNIVLLHQTLHNKDVNKDQRKFIDDDRSDGNNSQKK